MERVYRVGLYGRIFFGLGASAMIVFIASMMLFIPQKDKTTYFAEKKGLLNIPWFEFKVDPNPPAVAD